MSSSGIREHSIRSTAPAAATATGCWSCTTSPASYVTSTRARVPRSGSTAANAASAAAPPIDMLADGDYDEVLDAIERLHAGAM